VHPGQPRGARAIHALQRVGDRDQPGADATIARPPRPPAQLLRTNVLTDRQRRHCGFPPPRPQHLLLATCFRCNSPGESASTQVGITYGAFFKAPSFEQAQEWRLVSALIYAPLFRKGKSMIIPYTPLPINAAENFSINHAFVGPCP